MGKNKKDAQSDLNKDKYANMTNAQKAQAMQEQIAMLPEEAQPQAKEAAKDILDHLKGQSPDTPAQGAQQPKTQPDQQQDSQPSMGTWYEILMRKLMRANQEYKRLQKEGALDKSDKPGLISKIGQSLKDFHEDYKLNKLREAEEKELKEEQAFQAQENAEEKLEDREEHALEQEKEAFERRVEQEEKQDQALENQQDQTSERVNQNVEVEELEQQPEQEFPNPPNKPLPDDPAPNYQAPEPPQRGNFDQAYKTQESNVNQQADQTKENANDNAAEKKVEQSPGPQNTN